MKRLALAAAILACGCVSILPATPPPPPRYDLTAPTVALGDVRIEAGLTVAQPTSVSALDTAAVAISRGEYRIAYHEDLQWSDRAPRLVQTLMIRSLENSGAFPNVAARSAGTGARYVLRSDLRRFQYDAERREAVVELRAAIHDVELGLIVAAETIAERAASTDGEIAAIDAANDQAMDRLVRFAAAALGSDK